MKNLKFSISQLIIDENQFSINDFDGLERDYVDTDTIGNDKDEKYILKITKCTANRSENRFVEVYQLYGGRFPYPTEIVGEDLNTHPNPRSPGEIELDKQFFALIDCLQQRIYISDQQRKYSFCDWLGNKINKLVEIKSIINEKDFINKIRSIDKVYLSVEPNLLNSYAGTLSNEFVDHIYRFGADRAKIEFQYNQTKISEQIKTRLESIFKQQETAKNLVVIGRDDKGFESIFNSGEIISKIGVDVEEDPVSKLAIAEYVFPALIEKIKNV